MTSVSSDEENIHLLCCAKETLECQSGSPRVLQSSASDGSTCNIERQKKILPSRNDAMFQPKECEIALKSYTANIPGTSETDLTKSDGMVESHGAEISPDPPVVAEEGKHKVLKQFLTKILAPQYTFLTNSGIRPCDYKMKVTLVLRDYAEFRLLVLILKHLPYDIPIQELFTILLSNIPVCSLHWVFEDILDLFEYSFSHSKLFIAARDALHRNKDIATQFKECHLSDSVAYRVEVFVELDNKKLCVVVICSNEESKRC